MPDKTQSISEELSKFYHKNLSSLTQDFNDSEESTFRNDKRKINTSYWDSFLKDIKGKLPNISYIEDRSDGGVSNILLISIQEKERTLQFVWCISKLINYYCYYTNYIESDNITIPKLPGIASIPILRFDDIEVNTNYKRTWNKVDNKYLPLFQKVNDSIKEFYPTLKLIDEELLFTILEYYSTPSFDLGNATIYNLAFSDNLFP